MARFLSDLRYGFRLLWKAPGWTAVVGATLALVIGLSTAIFSLADNILLNALPYPDAGRLVMLWATSANAAAAGVARFNPSSADWRDWREQSKLLEDSALTRATSFNLTGDGRPERVVAVRASSNLLAVLGLQPLRGRMFTEEEAAGDAKVALLSSGFWQRRFGGDPNVVGRGVELDGESFVVIGVVPLALQFPSRDFDVLAPLFIPPAEIQSRLGFLYRSVGRLKPGVTLQQAQAEMSAIMERLAKQYPASNGKLGTEVLVEPLLDSTVGKFRNTLYVLIAAVGSLLLVGCINLGGLLIVRASARTHELALRAALGADPAVLRRQALAEVLPLSVAGGVGGALLAWGLLKVLVPLLPAGLPGPDSIRLSATLLAFAFVLSVAVVLIAGLLPARQAARLSLSGALQQGTRTVAGGGSFRNVLVVAQMAVAVLLVFVGSLLLRSLAAVLEVDPGFSTKGVLTMHLEATRAKYPTAAQVADYYRRLVARVETVPGVQGAGFISHLPLGSSRLSGPVYFERTEDGSWFGADSRSVTPGYFSAMGIPLVRGRDFDDEDGDGAPLVGIIDEQLARKVFGDADPLGERMRFGVVTDSTPWVEIVGVVGHIRSESLETDPRPQVYWPMAQQSVDRAALVVRTAGRPETFVATVAEQIQDENPDQPVYAVRSMPEQIGLSLRSRNLLTGLMAVLAGSSLLLACLGLYGVVSYATRLRLRELAVRMALGARPGEARRLVLAHAGRLAILGLVIGLGAAQAVGRVLRSQLYGVGSTDVVALALVPSLVLVTALAAALGPARRARRVDPALVLRGE
jgi:putative ABC transport system permease protein